MSLENNLTLQILEKAEREGYGILAQCWHVAKLLTIHRLRNPNSGRLE
jgi:hypothetical protein